MQINNKIAENISILGVNPVLPSTKIEENNSFKNSIFEELTKDDLTISETFLPTDETSQVSKDKTDFDLSEALIENRVQGEEELENKFIELLQENKNIEINHTTNLTEQKADIKKGNVNPVHDGVVTLKPHDSNISNRETAEKISRYTKPYNDGSNYADALDLYL